MTEKTQGHSAGESTARKGSINRDGRSTGSKSSSVQSSSSTTKKPYSHNTSKRTFTKGSRPSRFNKPAHKSRPSHKVPALADGDIRVVPVSGVEWVTNNMTFVEFKDEIIVIDAGFGFPNI